MRDTHRFRFNDVLPVLLAGVLASLVQVADARLYRWVDADGHVTYGDQAPGGQSGSGAQELSRDGVRRVAPVVPAAQAPDKIVDQAQREREARDAVLLRTFGSTEELEFARQQRLSQIDARIEAGRKQLTGLESSVKDFEDRAARQDPKLPRNYQEQVDALKRAMGAAQIGVDRAIEDRARAEAEFAGDLSRLRELRP